MRYLKLLSLPHLVDDLLPPRHVLVLEEGEPHLSRVALAGDLLDPGLLGPNVLGHLPFERVGDVRQIVPVTVMIGLGVSNLLRTAALEINVEKK